VVNVTGGGKTVISESLSVASRQCTIVLAGAGDESVALQIAGKVPSRRDLTVKTANGHSYDSINEAIDYLTSGKHPELLEMATHQFPLDQVMDALDTAGGERGPGAIHVTLVP
jgi:threonine dehydrogenase-like Zn-dependent dehydrogenase